METFSRFPLQGLSAIVCRMKWKTILLIGAAMTAATGCERKPAASPTPPPAEVSVTAAISEPVSVTTELPGRFEPVRVAEVRARVAGILLRKAFVEGADVKAGDLLFQIDPAPLQAAQNSAKAALARAEASLKQAAAQAARYRELVEINAVSRQDYDNASASQQIFEAEVLAAKAALENATLNLGYTRVTAPISGHIGKAWATEGALVGQGETTKLAVIHQIDPIYFDFTQSSTEAMRLKSALKGGKLKDIKPGEAQATLLLEDGTSYAQAGRLLFSDLAVDETTGMVTLRAEFPNPDRILLPGMFARVRLEQAVNTAAITVPQRAVTRGAGSTATVLVVKPDQKVELRTIDVDAAIGDKWIVSSGLAAGETVIVEGLQKVRPGAFVKSVPFGGSGTNSAASQPVKQGA
jgi:membrane fusion protein (multidrug efflux system)